MKTGAVLLKDSVLQKPEYCTVEIKYNGGQMVGASFVTNGAEGGCANH